MNDTDGPAISHPLAGKTMIVCATKIDSANPDKLKKLSAHIKRKKLEFHAISAVTGQGIEELKWSLARHLRAKPDLFKPLLSAPKVDDFEVKYSRDTGGEIDLDNEG
jgi:GTPase involved in cell partitioning and DNA repair